MQLHRHTLLLIVIFYSLSSASAQSPATATAPAPAAVPTPTPAPTPIQMRVRTAVADSVNNVVGIGDRIVVEVEHLSDAIANDQLSPSDLVLYLDGRPLMGVNASVTGDPRMNQLSFELKRTDQSRAAWSALIGRPKLTSNLRPVTVSVGFPDKQALPFSESAQTVYLRIYRGWAAALAAIALMLLFILLVLWAKRGYLIRDAFPPYPPAGAKRPYSLALTQSAWWSFMVIGSFLLIYVVTGDYNTMSDAALILMVIGFATALTAVMIDAAKNEACTTRLSDLRPVKAKLAAEVTELSAEQARLGEMIPSVSAAEIAEHRRALHEGTVALQEQQAKLVEIDTSIAEAEAGLSKPVSEGFGRDLLTDVNGLALHRLQLVVWTIILGALFVMGVYNELAMPQFSGTLLVLMVISCVTYLGFKIAERQN